MQFINAFFAVLSLFLLRRIVIKQTNDIDRANVWTFFVGAGFGVMRFAVEAEAYILPIFFSLISTYFYFNYLQNKKIINVFFCSLFISFACLFHQIHLFWGIGLFFGFLLTGKIRHVFLFSMITLFVPFVYSLVLVFHYQIDFSFENLIKFLGEYYYSDKADVKFGLLNFMITPVTFFRTFFQVHGIVPEILRLIPIFFIIIPVVLFFIISFVINLIKSISFKQLKLAQKNSFEVTHFLIFTFQFTFAFYSHGNSEFMVMLPFAIPLFINMFISYNLKAIKHIALAMLIWNFFFAVFPNNYFDYQNNKALIALIKQNPDKVFILKERNVLVNQYYYEVGNDEYSRLIDNQNKESIKSLYDVDKVIYTDLLSKRVPFNRANVVLPSDNSNLVFIRHITRINSELGGFFVDEIRLKKE
jgi:hypothetical protein